MTPTTTTPSSITVEQMLDTIVANARAKPGRWLSASFEVQGYPTRVGVKAYGKWVQRIECCGLVDGVPEQRTLTALRAETARTPAAMLRSL